MPKIKDKPRQGQMGRYRLLESLHVEPDWKAEHPRDEDGNLVKPWRRPSVQYTRGQVVVSPTDLVSKFGANKFQYLGSAESADGPFTQTTPGDPVPDIAANNPQAAPGGQVSQGFQVTTTGPDGKPISGPMTPETEPNAVANPKTGERILGQKANIFGKPGAKAERDEGEDPQPRTPRQATAEEAGEPAGGASKHTREDLEDKTMAELRDLADEEEIDVHGARNKEDLIQRILRG